MAHMLPSTLSFCLILILSVDLRVTQTPPRLPFLVTSQVAFQHFLEAIKSIGLIEPLKLAV